MGGPLAWSGYRRRGSNRVHSPHTSLFDTNRDQTHRVLMKRRWASFVAIGIVFGALDFYYLGFLSQFPWTIWHFVVLNLGVWLIPIIPVALYEARRSRSSLHSALAGIVTWCAAIVAYYLTNAVHLAFVGVPGRSELHVSSYGSETFWTNWAGVFRGSILGGISEWLLVAVIGGAIIGFLTGLGYLWFTRRSATHKGERSPHEEAQHA